MNGLNFKDRATNEIHAVALEGVFVQVGLVPNTESLKATLELSKYGEIVVDAKGHTNLPGVFAAGDGSKAAVSAFDFLIRSHDLVAA